MKIGLQLKSNFESHWICTLQFLYIINYNYEYFFSIFFNWKAESYDSRADPII